MFIHRGVSEAGQDRKNDSKVKGRLCLAYASRQVDIGIELGHGDPHSFFYYGHEEAHSVDVRAGGLSLWITITRPADQGLDLKQEGARPFHGAGDDTARRILRPAVQQKLGRVLNFGQAVSPHFKNTDLVCRSIAVLDAAQDPVGGISVPLKIEDSVHHMFQDTGTRYIALLCHMADQEKGDPRLFRESQEDTCRLPHLGDTARRCLDPGAVHSLDGVNDCQTGLFLLESLCDRIEVCLT